MKKLSKILFLTLFVLLFNIVAYADDLVPGSSLDLDIQDSDTGILPIANPSLNGHYWFNSSVDYLLSVNSSSFQSGYYGPSLTNSYSLPYAANNLPSLLGILPLTNTSGVHNSTTNFGTTVIFGDTSSSFFPVLSVYTGTGTNVNYNLFRINSYSIITGQNNGNTYLPISYFGSDTARLIPWFYHIHDSTLSVKSLYTDLDNFVVWNGINVGMFHVYDSTHSTFVKNSSGYETFMNSSTLFLDFDTDIDYVPYLSFSNRPVLSPGTYYLRYFSVNVKNAIGAKDQFYATYGDLVTRVDGVTQSQSFTTVDGITTIKIVIGSNGGFIDGLSCSSDFIGFVQFLDVTYDSNGFNGDSISTGPYEPSDQPSNQDIIDALNSGVGQIKDAMSSNTTTLQQFINSAASSISDSVDDAAKSVTNSLNGNFNQLEHGYTVSAEDSSAADDLESNVDAYISAEDVLEESVDSVDIVSLFSDADLSFAVDGFDFVNEWVSAIIESVGNFSAPFVVGCVVFLASCLLGLYRFGSRKDGS